ncbi:SDR family NAD(P)-dependent oxidoreductase [Novosphingobium colocasiae]|uniref:SDR family NAD(P)-dependent oxidoreductase n=1 Tax=Novosphingobium colocasiae TaxID=1256513 RepID=UPI0035AEA77F
MTDGAVLVTGALGGIGSAICTRFLAAGWFVVGTDLSQAGPPHVSAYVPADLRAIAHNASARAAFHDAVIAALGPARLRTLVNNAATQRLAPTGALAIDDWQATQDINVTAPFVLTQLLRENLRDAQGCVVNIGSVQAQATKREFVAYATSKAALHGLTRALAVDLGPDIRAMARCICSTIRLPTTSSGTGSMGRPGWSTWPCACGGYPAMARWGRHGRIR